MARTGVPGLALALALVPLAAVRAEVASGSQEIASRIEDGAKFYSLNDLLRPYGATRRLDTVVGLVRVHVGDEDLDFLPGSRLVKGTSRSWMLPEPVLNREGTLWVVGDFVRDVLGNVVAPGPQLDGDALSVGAPTARIDSVRVFSVSQGREVVIDGRFPKPPELVPGKGRATLRFPGCVAGRAPVRAPRDSLVTSVRLGQGDGEARLHVKLSPRASGYNWSEQSPNRVRIVFGPDSLGLVRLPSGPPVARTPIHRVVIDAGHGGNDFGARLRAGIHEKWVTLDLARTVADSLRAAGFEIVMVRNEDRSLAPEERAGAANASDGDVFLTINVDSYGGPNVPEVQCVTQRTLQGAEAATRSVSGIRMVPWATVQMPHARDSAALARWILDATQADPSVEPLSLPLRVLEGVDMPAVAIVLAAGVTAPEVWQAWRQRFAHNVVPALRGFAGGVPPSPLGFGGGRTP